MSIGINSYGLGLNTAMGLNSNFAIQQNTESIFQMLANPNKYPPHVALQMEKELLFDKLTNELTVKITDEMAESAKKQLDKNIKSSYSTFL